MIACDFSWQRPAPSDFGAIGALVYDKTFGNQSSPEQYRSELVAAGVTVAGIHEEYGTEAYEGCTRGRSAAHIADAVFSPGVLIYYNAGDTPNVSGHEAQITDYFRCVGEATREPVIGAYGALAALRAAQAGSPKVQRLWGVETWHPQAHNNGDPRNVDLWRAEGVHLLQMVGDGPLPGTDLDLVFQDNWASIGAAPFPVLGDDVIYHLTQAAGGAAANTYWGYTTSRWVAIPALSPGVVAQDIDATAFVDVQKEQEAFRKLIAGPVNGGSSNPVKLNVTLSGTAEPV